MLEEEDQHGGSGRLELLWAGLFGLKLVCWASVVLYLMACVLNGLKELLEIEKKGPRFNLLIGLRISLITK